MKVTVEAWLPDAEIWHLEPQDFGTTPLERLAVERPAKIPVALETAWLEAGLQKHLFAEWNLGIRRAIRDYDRRHH